MASEMDKADQGELRRLASRMLDLVDNYSHDDCTAFVHLQPASDGAESRQAFQIVIVWHDDAKPLVIFGDEA